MADKKNTLLIHIGTPKTGSTALQKFLYQNREKLKKYGWYYPDLKARFPHYKTNDTGSNKNGDLFLNEETQLHIEGERWKNVWIEVTNELQKNNVIISSEELYTIDKDKFFQEAKNVYDNIKVIIYLRRQDLFIESVWKQIVKDTVCLETKIEDTNWSALEQYFYYYKNIEQIENILGKDNLIVRVYEKGQFDGLDGSIISDFMFQIGIMELDEFIPVCYVNESIDDNFLEIKRIVNKVLNKNKTYKNALNEYFLKNLFKVQGKEKIGYGYLSEKERRKILEYFADENENVAKKYLGREDGKLFYDQKIDIPKYEINTYEFMRDTIELFSEMLVEQRILFERYVGIERKGFALLKSKISSVVMKKKILLFGAGERCNYLLDNMDMRIDAIIDNDIRKSGTYIQEKLVKNPRDIDDWQEYFVVITCKESKDIELQLQRYGMVKDEDYILMNEYI